MHRGVGSPLCGAIPGAFIVAWGERFGEFCDPEGTVFGAFSSQTEMHRNRGVRGPENAPNDVGP